MVDKSQDNCDRGPQQVEFDTAMVQRLAGLASVPLWSGDAEHVASLLTSTLRAADKISGDISWEISPETPAFDPRW